MNLHLVAWLAIGLTFVILSGGAYVLDQWIPELQRVSVWSHEPGRFARTFLFYAGLYALVNVGYHLVGLSRVRRHLQQARRDGDLARLAVLSRPRDGTGASELERVELGASSPAGTFARNITVRVWEIRSAARATLTTGVLSLLAGILSTIVQWHAHFRAAALTGSVPGVASWSWTASESLSMFALGLFLATSCSFGAYVLRVGVAEAAETLGALESRLSR